MPRSAARLEIFIEEPAARKAQVIEDYFSFFHLPFGGIYLIGGVARAFQPYLERFDFAGAFRDKGRFAGFMGNFAVSVIEDDYAALTGCAVYLENGGQG